MVTAPDSVSMDELSNWWIRAALQEIESENQQLDADNTDLEEQEVEDEN